MLESGKVRVGMDKALAVSGCLCLILVRQGKEAPRSRFGMDEALAMSGCLCLILLRQGKEAPLLGSAEAAAES